MGAGARRAAIGVVALYALLLQAFFAAVSSPSAFADPNEATCFQEGAPSSRPAGAPHHPRGICCVLACAGAGSACLPTMHCGWAFRRVAISLTAWSSIPASRADRPLEASFFARGPPQRL